MKSEVRIQEAITILIDNVTCGNIPKMTKPTLKIRKKTVKELSSIEHEPSFFFFPKHFNDSQSTVVKKSIPPNTPFSLSDSKCKQPGFSKATGQATSTYKLGLSNTDTQQKLFLFMSCMSFLSHMSKLPKLFEQFQANT